MLQKIGSQRFLVTAIGFVGIAALASAYIAEYAFGIQPCHLCLVERYFYTALAVLGIVSTLKYHPIFFYLTSLTVLIGIGASFYHIGVEFHWWQAPSSCVGATAPSGNFDDFYAQFMKKPLVRCDQTNWVVLGLSATIWNAILFCALGFYCLLYSLIVKNKSC